MTESRIPNPASRLHDDKILKYPDGQIFDIMSNGQGLMPAYRWPIPPADRWAIIAYIRELERKRLATAPSAPSAPSTPAATNASADKPAGSQ